MNDSESSEEILRAIGRTSMPFGMFGPAKYPPQGVPIYDLPLEYLAWFAVRTFPKGRLGYLMRVVYEAKAAGCDEIFDPLRRARGGRFRLRPVHPREYHFEDHEED
jgi:uncharacterized protein (DUF3820 family)